VSDPQTEPDVIEGTGTFTPPPDEPDDDEEKDN